MARTQTTLCNLALARVGSPPLTDLATDATAGVKGAVACRAVLAEVVKECARAGRWNCLKARASLTSTYATAYATAYAAWLDDHPDDTAGAAAAGVTAGEAANPAFGWARAYPLPGDCVRLLQLNGVAIYNDGPGDFCEIEGRSLLTDAEDAAEIQYIAYDETAEDYNYDAWDGLFLDAVVVLLASKIAFTLRQDSAQEQALRNEFERVTLPRARQKNGDERKRQLADPSEQSKFVAARRTATRG